MQTYQVREGEWGRGDEGKGREGRGGGTQTRKTILRGRWGRGGGGGRGDNTKEAKSASNTARFEADLSGHRRGPF